MSYGSDFLLDEGGDMVITPLGEALTEVSSRLIAQDLAEALGTPKGSLPWGREAGSSLPQALNDTSLEEGDILYELKRLALADPRIDAATVEAREEGGRFILSYTALGESAPRELTLEGGRK